MNCECVRCSHTKKYHHSEVLARHHYKEKVGDNDAHVHPLGRCRRPSLGQARAVYRPPTACASTRDETHPPRRPWWPLPRLAAPRPRACEATFARSSCQPPSSFRRERVIPSADSPPRKSPRVSANEARHSSRRQGEGASAKIHDARAPSFHFRQPSRACWVQRRARRARA